MIQEKRELLLKDISARLPYNVVVRCTDGDTDYNCFLTTDILHEIQNGYEDYDYKPYLRPMNTMTEEEADEFEKISNELLENGESTEIWDTVVDWLNAHHFDHRGLIPMGLALEAKKGMYNN